MGSFFFFLFFFFPKLMFVKIQPTSKAPFVSTEIDFRKSISGKSCVWLCCKIRSNWKCFQFDRKISQKRLKLISVVIFTSIGFLPSLTRTSLSHTHCSVKPSPLRPTLRSAHDSTQPSSDPLRGPVTIQARRTRRKSLRSTPIRSRSKLDALDENHSDPSSDPLTIQAPIRSQSKLQSTPHRKRNKLRSTPRIPKIAPIHSDPSSDSVNAHGEFSEHVSHSDLIFLRSTLISPVHCFSISGRQPHFSDPQIITSVLTPTHCHACSLIFFYYYI